MTRDELAMSLRQTGENFQETSDQSWSIDLHGTRVTIFCNEAKDRMRAMAAIGFVVDMHPDQLIRALRANFHSDPRYCIMDEVLYAAFIHSLSDLNVSQLSSGMNQVVAMVSSYGTTFSSGPLRFQWPRGPSRPSGGVRRRTLEAVRDKLRKSRH